MPNESGMIWVVFPPIFGSTFIYHTLPETNSEFTPKNGWLEYFLLSYWGKTAYFQGAFTETETKHRNEPPKPTLDSMDSPQEVDLRWLFFFGNDPNIGVFRPFWAGIIYLLVGGFKTSEKY